MPRQRARKMLSASRVMHSNPPISAHANPFLRTNELLWIKPVLLGIDWIPLILWFPLPSEKKLRSSPMLSPFPPDSANSNRFYGKNNLQFDMPVSSASIPVASNSPISHIIYSSWETLSSNLFGGIDDWNPVPRIFLNQSYPCLRYVYFVLSLSIDV